MSITLMQNLGVYFPSFFIMDLGVGDEVDDLNQMTDYQKAVFIHEYVHYLQDITTLFGLMNCCHIVNLLKFYANYIRESKSDSYHVPIIIPSSDVGGTNRELLSLYTGDYKSIHNYEIECISSKPNNLIDGFKHAPTIEVSIKNHPTPVSFGAIAIIESMAYAIEQELSEQLISSPEYPYDAVEKIVDNLYPQLLSSRLNLIALCDASLLSNFHPGKFLYETVQKMKKEQFTTDDYKEVYSYCLSGSVEFHGKSLGVMDMFSEISTQAEKQLGDLFTNDFTGPIKDWIVNKITLGRDLRMAEQSFFADMVSLDKTQRQQEFSRYTHVFEVPLIRWPSGRYQVSDTTIGANLPIFAGIKNIFDLFSSGNAACDMRHFCDGVDHRNKLRKYCTQNPWETSTHDPLCDYAVPWKMWGLEGKTPSIR